MVDVVVFIPTSDEAQEIIKYLNKKAFMGFCGLECRQGVVCQRKIALVITGVGKVNASIAATLAVEKLNPKKMILLGVAGAYPSSGLNVLDLAMATHEIYADEGCITSRGWLDMEDIGRPLLSLRGRNYYNIFPLVVVEEIKNTISTGLFVTLSAITGSGKRAKEIERLYPGVLCENMEGAAIAHVAALYDKDLIEIRAVSNMVEDRKRDTWKIKEASLKVQKFFLENLEVLV